MATTTNFGFNTPNDTDLVKDGALAIRTLGNNIDARFGNVATYPNQIVNVVSGVSRPIAFAQSSGTATANYSASLSASVAVTFPASRFTQAPLVTISGTTNTTLCRLSIWQTISVTTSGFTAFATYGPATPAQTGAVSAAWTATQMTSATSAG